jgi:hypothetical protein
VIVARLKIHLVHGTQFYCWRKPRIPWVEIDDPKAAENADKPSFRSGLRNQLRAKGHTVEFHEIPWTGRNRHGARLEAARDILESVPVEDDGFHHFIIAHSHGGNACMLAFKDDHKRRMSGIAGVACLATPFLIVREAAWAQVAPIPWMSLTALGTGFAEE